MHNITLRRTTPSQFRFLYGRPIGNRNFFKHQYRLKCGSHLTHNSKLTDNPKPKYNYNCDFDMYFTFYNAFAIGFGIFAMMVKFIGAWIKIFGRLDYKDGKYIFERFITTEPITHYIYNSFMEFFLDVSPIILLDCIPAGIICAIFGYLIPPTLVITGLPIYGIYKSLRFIRK